MGARKVGEKQRNYMGFDLPTLRDFIVAVDGYRVHSYTDIETMDKAIDEGRMGNKFTEQWEETRKTLVKMANSTATIPGIIRSIKIRDAINLLSMVLITVTFVLIIVQLLLKQTLVGIYTDLIYVSAFVLLIGSMMSRFLINRYVGLKIEKYYAENPEKFKPQIERLREVTQDLLDILSRSIRPSGAEAQDYAMKLFNADYKRITVAQEPTRWRKYYVILPKATVQSRNDSLSSN